MASTIKFTDDLGQHMTPPALARLVAAEIPVALTAAIDLSVGDGALLAGVAERWPEAKLHGIDCDGRRLVEAAQNVGGVKLIHGDGLSVPLPRPRSSNKGRLAFIGNPPFLFAHRADLANEWQAQAFSGVESRHGPRRIEMSFLARALVEARKHSGIVAMLMPSPFASGLLYAPYRRSLLADYRLLKVVTIENAGFRDTEASTVLLIVDTSGRPTRSIEISRFESTTEEKRIIYKGMVGSVDRLDAGYWSAIDLHRAGGPTLADVGVDVTRGRFCKADAVRQRQQVLHTTDLCRHVGPTIHLPRASHSDDHHVLARAGDILLSRTGSRVRWEPVTVASGTAPITDHVLRIRAPSRVRHTVEASFRHPHFQTWLASVSKGVCATVITKQELLQMPLFAAK